MINIIQVGFGSVGQRRSKLLMADPRVELVGIADSNPEAVAQAQAIYSDIPVDTGYNQLIEQTDPHAVIVSTPHYLHEELTTTALAQNRHVLCEKPFGLNLQQALTCSLAAESHQKILKLAANHLYFPTIIRAMEALKAGRIGAINKIHIRIGHGKLLELAPWFRNPIMSGGGTLRDNGFHAVLLLTKLLALDNDVPKEVSSYLDFAPEYPDIDVFANCNLHTANDKTINIQSRWIGSRGYQFEVDITGATGCLQIRGPEDICLINESGTTPLDTLPSDASFSWRLDTADFIDALEQNIAPETTHKDALQCVQLIDALYQSWDAQRTIPVPVLNGHVPEMTIAS